MELKRIAELANNILNNVEIVQIKHGLEKLISELEADYLEAIDTAKDDFGKFKDLRFDYFKDGTWLTTRELVSIGCALAERDWDFLDDKSFNHKDYQRYRDDRFFALGLRLYKLYRNKHWEDYYTAVLLWITLQNELRLVLEGMRILRTSKKADFRAIIQYPNKDNLIKRLHELIDGKGGAEVGAVLLNAYFINPYLTRRPTQAEFESEFELIGSWSAISNYLNENNSNALDKANKIVIFQ